MADDIGPFAGLPGIFTGVFGEPVDYRPAAGGTMPPTSGIFIRPFHLADFGETGGVEGMAPELHVRADDLPTAAHGDALTVRGTNFKVVGVEPDGQGMIRLILHEDD